VALALSGIEVTYFSLVSSDLESDRYSTIESTVVASTAGLTALLKQIRSLLC